jgi:PKD repeat protein
LKQYLFILLVGLSWSVRAQAPVANFSVKANACIGESLAFTNLSTQATAASWDFCLQDINHHQQTMLVTAVPGIQNGSAYKLVEANGNWFGFVASWNNSQLFRLDFGNSPSNVPTINNLGNLNGKLFLPWGIEVIYSNNEWFGFISSYDPSTGVLKLEFGNAPDNAPTVTDLGQFGFTTRYMEVKAVVDGSNNFLVLSAGDRGSITRVNFLSSFHNTPLPANITDTGYIAGTANPRGLDVAKVGSNWIVLLTDQTTNSLYRLNFGANLPGSAVVENIYTLPTLAAPGKVKILREGPRYTAIVSQLNQGVIALDLQGFLTTDAVTDITPVSLPVLYGIDVVRINGATVVEGVSATDNNLQFLKFQSTCDASADNSQQITPSFITYASGGSKDIELIAVNAGLQSVTSHTVTVSALTAPGVSFTTDGTVCAGVPIAFTGFGTNGPITNYAWDFGDSNTGTGSTANHTYAAGNYTAQLTVTASNACTNLFRKPVTIYTPPVANFSIPAPAVYCTQQAYPLTNTSVIDPTSSPGWEWRLNGSLVSTQTNYTAQFSTATAQELRLKATLPGCQNEVTKNIATVAIGPSVSFTVSDACQGSVVPFNNTTTGADQGYAWTFGDAGTSVAVSPTHTFTNAGTYSVTLTASNTAGCQNFVTKPVKIYSLPQPSFTTGLPPFSCNNTSTPFANTTPPLTDSNLTAWSWSMGDVSGGTSTQFAPSYVYSTAGNYTVSLTAFSDAGCQATVSSGITISPSPTADFTQTAACANQLTRFTDLSTGGVQSRNWQIATSAFTIANPTYSFTSSGSYTASLTVTSANGCSHVKTRTIIVPVVPTLNFSLDNACATTGSQFTDLTQTSDPISGWNWLVDTNALTGNPAAYVFPLSGTFAAKLTTTHTSGCTYSLTRNVVINPSPVASFTAAPDRGAAPLTVQFTNTSTGATSYAWKFLDKVPSTSTRISPVFTFASLGTYAAELTATNDFGCQSVMSKPIVVLVPSIDLSLTDFSLLTDPITGNMKCQVTIFNNSNIPMEAATVALYLGNKAVVNETVRIDLAPGLSASRTLSFTVSPGSFDFTFLCAEIQSEKDIQADNNRKCVNLATGDYFFAPYPNPSSGVLQVDWIGQKTGTAVVRIFDDKGMKVYEWETATHSGLNQGVLDVSFLTAGLYYVQVQTGTSSKTMRFMRQ